MAERSMQAVLVMAACAASSSPSRAIELECVMSAWSSSAVHDQAGVDRILREAFSKEETLAWVEANLPNESGMTHTKDGRAMPTKRAEALCFVYRGRPTARVANEHDDGQGPALFEDVFARVFVATRDRLQQIKHDDHGTPEEKDQLVSLMTGPEGALMPGLFISQIGATPDSQLEEAEAQG
ncbi:hypothetical protein J7E97_29245 [Streptomyces sp. ISL-66]|uniref:hypothetical protein n=1 Tax=Streptomyces sp. ISL-66 TaxID=2819186 RepID=UPI001BE7A8FB|nr:hypothetical protein [Streptomyces sp. ISL-66]MBT2471835.1 hypothetical protein [Streptomyces sp. ISL-66]